MPNHLSFPAEKVAAIQAALAEGKLNQQAIADQFKVSKSAVNKINTGKSGSLPATPIPKPKQGRPGGKYAHLLPQIMQMKEQKFSFAEIAEKLKIPRTSLNYYMYGMNRNRKSTQHEEGALTNGNAINKNIAIGIAYAETERFITNISQRLGLSTDVLRQRLSELLGRSPLR